MSLHSRSLQTKFPIPLCPKGQKHARQIPAEQTPASRVSRAYKLCLVTSQPETSMSSEVSEKCSWERLSSQTSPWQLSTAWPWDSCCQLPRDAGWGTGGGISRIQMCQQAMLSRCEDTPGQTHSSSPTRDTAPGGGWAEGRPKEKGMTLTAPPTVLRVPPLLTSLHE